MDKKTLFWILGVGLLAAGWKLVESCSCFPEHPQNQYCKSDFAIIAIPRGRTADNSSVIFTMKIRAMLKASRTAKSALRKGKIYTGLDSAQCGVDYAINQTYVILGSVGNGKAYTGLCNFNTLYSDLTAEQRRGFNSEYGRSCGCSIDTCFGTDCTKLKTNCVYNNTFDNSLYCYSSHGICSRNRRGRCDWFYNRRYADDTPLVECLNTTNINV